MCAFTGRKADEKCEYLFVRSRSEDGCFGVHKQDGGKVDFHPAYLEDSLKSLMQ